MAVSRMRFSILGDVQYSRAFEVYAGEADDLTEPLQDIAESLRLSISEQFRSEGAHGLGGQWPALNPAYARWKRSVVGDQPMLVFTGEMRDEMTSQSAFTVSPQRMIYEPNDPKAIHHQRGDGSLPAREMVALNEGDRRSWDRHFATWLNSLRRGPMGVR